jgi:predicted nucleic acid-binding protein
MQRVLVDNQRTARYSERIADCPGSIRNCSVVLAELWRGATVATERRFVKALEQSRPVSTPTERCWLESGRLLAKMRADKGFEPQKLRDLHLDVLIALTARANDALVITSNRDDFELIRGYREFGLEVW